MTLLSTCNLNYHPQQQLLYSGLKEEKIQEVLDCEERNIQGNTKPYLSVPIRRPKPELLEGKEYTFSANDCSVGDLDGDGEYEIVVKWMPSLTKLPPQKGLSGKTYLDAYKMDGTFLWRIDLGYNIRSGAPTTNFLVFDFDGDGCAIWERAAE